MRTENTRPIPQSYVFQVIIPRTLLSQLALTPQHSLLLKEPYCRPTGSHLQKGAGSSHRYIQSHLAQEELHLS